MKGTLEFDPDAYDYGPATGSVRAILRQVAGIDWFVPPGIAGNDALALVHEQVARANRFEPRTYPEPVRADVLVGDWSDFAKLRATVSGTGAKSDWKFGVLKPLSRAHSKARGWTPEAHAARHQQAPSAGAFVPGNLFATIGGQTLWLAPWPKLDFSELGPAHRDAAQWYVSYAFMDALECIAWQLAEASDDVTTNPFVPLLSLYAGGYYPFATSATVITLFCYARAAAAPCR